MYDYGARFYDPQIGRLTTQDPLGSIIPEINPYHYCFNNPVAYTDPSGMLPMLDYPNYISSAFVDPKGKIIKVIDDGDNNIYLVHDPSTWDGSSKDGLTIIGQTPTPTTLAGFEGKNLRSEEVINYIFDEADRLNKLGWLSWQILAHLENIAQLNRDREEVIKLLKEMKKLRKDQLILLLEMMKKEEVYLNYLQSQPSIKTVAGIRLIVSLIGTLMGNIVGIETTDVSGKSSDYIIPSSRYDEIDAEVEAQAKKIISKYDEMIKKIQSR